MALKLPRHSVRHLRAVDETSVCTAEARVKRFRGGAGIPVPIMGRSRDQPASRLAVTLYLQFVLGGNDSHLGGFRSLEDKVAVEFDHCGARRDGFRAGDLDLVVVLRMASDGPDAPDK